MHLLNFDYLSPKELATMLAEHGKKACIVSGGTDLLVQMKDHSLTPKYLIDISRLKSLSTISFDEHSGLVIGSAG